MNRLIVTLVLTVRTDTDGEGFDGIDLGRNENAHNILTDMIFVKSLTPAEFPKFKNLPPKRV